MNRWIAPALGFLAALTAGVAAQAQDPAPPEGIVWVALRDINAEYFDPDDPTNRPPLVTVPPAEMIRAVDVSPDGKADWLIDYQASGLSSMCGTGGCRQRLYVSDGDQYVRVLDAQALELTVRNHQIEVWVHHLYCVPDNPECRYVMAWDPSTRQLRQQSSSSAGLAEDSAWTPLPQAESQAEE